MIEGVKDVANMPIGEITSWATLIVVGFSILFEVTPIKFNPVSMFLGWIGKKLNKSVEEKVQKLEQTFDTRLDGLDSKVDELELKTDDNEIYRLRFEILDFANSCQNGRQHTREEFDHVLDALVRYERIIERRGMKNGQIEQAHRYLERLYQDWCDKNLFLK